MVHAQILSFYSTIIGALWQKTVTATRGCISQKGKVKIFISHITDISDFGLQDMLIYIMELILSSNYVSLTLRNRVNFIQINYGYRVQTA